MKYLILVYVLQRHRALKEPIEDELLGELFIPLLLPLDVERDITLYTNHVNINTFTILHDDYQRIVLVEALNVPNYVRVVELGQQCRLNYGACCDTSRSASSYSLFFRVFSMIFLAT